MSEVLVLNRDGAPLNYLPLSVIPWERAIKGVFLGSLVVIHEYADRPLRSQSMTIHMPSVVMTARYVRPKVHAPWSKDNLFLRDRHTCQYCQKRFPASDLTFDHVVPVKFGGETSWTNIVAACQPCNGRRGHNTRIQPVNAPYQPTYFDLLEKRKERELCVPDVAWVDYLQWPEEKLKVK